MSTCQFLLLPYLPLLRRSCVYPIVPLQLLCDFLIKPPGCSNSFLHHYTRIIALPFFLVRPFCPRRAKRKLDGLLHSRIYSLLFVLVFSYHWILGFGLWTFKSIHYSPPATLSASNGRPPTSGRTSENRGKKKRYLRR